MGMSSAKSKTKTKPIYEQEVKGAANLATDAYNAAAPKITGAADALYGLLPDLTQQFQQGDPNVNAAADYNRKVLMGDYLGSGNPYLQDQIDRTGADVRNGMAASLGTRGLTGGSAYSDIISRALANNAATLRFNDYNTERSRMDSAASMAPQISYARYQPLGVMGDIANAQTLSTRAANDVGSTIGNILGRYTNTTQTQSPGLMGVLGGAVGLGTDIAGLGSGLGLWKFAGGGK